MGYQLRTLLGKNDNGALPADSHSAANRWKISFVSHECMSTELITTGGLKWLHTVEPLVPLLTASEVEVITEMLKEVNQQVPMKFRHD